MPGKRTAKKCEEIIEDVKKRTGERTDLLLTSDQHAPYKTAILKAYAEESPQPKRDGPGRPPKPKRVMPEDLCYGTVRKTRKKGRIVEVVKTVVFGTLALLQTYLARSTASHALNTAFVERNNGTDRGQNGRKIRKTYGFSKDWVVHNALTFFVAYSYNFCWPVRTLRVKAPDGTWARRSPAMAAGLADHVWTIEEWVTYPPRPS